MVDLVLDFTIIKGESGFSDSIPFQISNSLPSFYFILLVLLFVCFDLFFGVLLFLDAYISEAIDLFFRVLLFLDLNSTNKRKKNSVKQLERCGPICRVKDG